MSQSQYLKMLEKELQKLNKIIDRKIIRGEDYLKEARDHRLILKKIHYHTKRGLLSRINSFFSKISYRFQF